MKASLTSFPNGFKKQIRLLQIFKEMDDINLIVYENNYIQNIITTCKNRNYRENY